MQLEKDHYYTITFYDGSSRTYQYKGEDPGNVLKFEKEDGSPYAIPTGGFEKIEPAKK